MVVILAMMSYYGTVSAISIMIPAMSISIYDKAQKNLGASTHRIDKTKLMQNMIPLSSGTYGTTYVKLSIS